MGSPAGTDRPFGWARQPSSALPAQQLAQHALPCGKLREESGGQAGGGSPATGSWEKARSSGAVPVCTCWHHEPPPTDVKKWHSAASRASPPARGNLQHSAEPHLWGRLWRLGAPAKEERGACWQSGTQLYNQAGRQSVKVAMQGVVPAYPQQLKGTHLPPLRRSASWCMLRSASSCSACRRRIEASTVAGRTRAAPSSLPLKAGWPAGAPSPVPGCAAAPPLGLLAGSAAGSSTPPPPTGCSSLWLCSAPAPQATEHSCHQSCRDSSSRVLLPRLSSARSTASRPPAPSPHTAPPSRASRASSDEPLVRK